MLLGTTIVLAALDKCCTQMSWGQKIPGFPAVWKGFWGVVTQLYYRTLRNFLFYTNVTSNLVTKHGYNGCKGVDILPGIHNFGVAPCAIPFRHILERPH